MKTLIRFLVFSVLIVAAIVVFPGVVEAAAGLVLALMGIALALVLTAVGGLTGLAAAGAGLFVVALVLGLPLLFLVGVVCLLILPFKLLFGACS